MKREKDIESSYKVQVIDRVFNILDSFTFENREMTLTDIAKNAGLNKTTAKRLLSNLTRRKYLQWDPKTKKYKLGLRLFELGGIVFSSFSLRKTVEQHMNYFRDKVGATVLLGVILENQLVYIDKREGNGMIRISSEIGWRRPLNYGMLGMVLLAYQDPDYVKKILDEYPLKSYTHYSITDKSKFLSRLEEIRKQGYVIETEEAVIGVIGIAAPIRDYTSKTVAALGIALPIRQEISESSVLSLARELKKLCDDVSSNMGFKKNDPPSASSEA